MRASWRAMVMSAVTTVAATGALSVVVDAAPAPTQPVARVAAAPRAAAPAEVAAAPLPPVTEHALDPAMVAAAQAGAASRGGQTVTQTIQLTIIGGELSLAADQATVALEPVPGSARDWTGALPPVRVVDARGTHEGWTVRWSVSSVDLTGTTGSSHLPTAKVHLDPAEPTVVAGLDEGLAAGRGGPAVRQGRTLFSAAPGTGGGTYEAGGTISLRLPRSADVSDVTVHLAFELS